MTPSSFTNLNYQPQTKTSMKQNQNCRDGYSLRERIAQASSVAEVQGLLDIGARFKHASRRTRQGWLNTSKCRIVDLLP